MVKNQIKPLSACQLGYGQKFSFCERKIYLRKEGLLSKYMPLLGFFLYISSHKYEKCTYSSHSIKLPLLHPYCILY